MSIDKENEIIKYLSKQIIREVLINPTNDLFDISHLNDYMVASKSALSGHPHNTKAGAKGTDGKVDAYLAVTVLSDAEGNKNAKVVASIEMANSAKVIVNISDSNVEMEESSTITRVNAFLFDITKIKSDERYVLLPHVLKLLAILYSTLVNTEWTKEFETKGNIYDGWFSEPAHMATKDGR